LCRIPGKGKEGKGPIRERRERERERRRKVGIAEEKRSGEIPTRESF